MEPKNHLIEKDNYLPNLHFWVPCQFATCFFKGYTAYHLDSWLIGTKDANFLQTNPCDDLGYSGSTIEKKHAKVDIIYRNFL